MIIKINNGNIKINKREPLIVNFSDYEPKKWVVGDTTVNYNIDSWYGESLMIPITNAKKIYIKSSNVDCEYSFWFTEIEITIANSVDELIKNNILYDHKQTIEKNKEDIILVPNDNIKYINIKSKYRNINPNELRNMLPEMMIIY